MTLFLLVEWWHHEGGIVHGVFTELEKAQEALPDTYWEFNENTGSWFGRNAQIVAGWSSLEIHKIKADTVLENIAS